MGNWSSALELLPLKELGAEQMKIVSSSTSLEKNF